MTDTLNYKELLKNYIKHVKKEDGNDFIGNMYFVANPLFTREEMKELKSIAKEIFNENGQG